MPNKKISQLPTTPPTSRTLQDTDQLPLARSGITYNIFGSDIKTPILSEANTTMLTKVNSLSARDSATIDLSFSSSSYALSANPLPGLIHSQSQITSLTANDEFLVWSALTESLKKVKYGNFGYDRSKLCASIGESRMTVSSFGNSFFIMQDGTLRACGANTSGAIGSGRRPTEKVTIPTICTFDPAIDINDKVVKVVTNYNTSFAITLNGYLYATGYNGQGQLGLGDTAARYVFTRVTSTSGSPALSAKIVTDVQAGTGNNNGSNAVHILTNDGLVYAFGDGSSGSLGLGSSANINSTPTRVTANIGSKTITQVLTLGGGNRATAFVLANDGTVWSAGDNTNGQLGRAGTATTFQQITFPEPTIVKLWGAGDSSSTTVWARGGTGKIYGWGYNGSYKAVGNNSTADVTTPVEVTALGTSGSAYVENIYGSVDTNSVTLFAKYTNGTIKAWGRNNYGQLGNETLIQVSSPTDVSSSWPFSSTAVIDIAVASSSASGGPTTTAFVLNDGYIYTAGYGGNGTLGNSLNSSTQNTFQKALFDPKVGTPVSILMGNHDTSNLMFFKSLLTNGKVLAWGYQTAGIPQLGTDSTPDIEYAPVTVLFF
jgi:alpha-tubulin suppressor-like RCC1 family protein